MWWPSQPAGVIGADPSRRHVLTGRWHRSRRFCSGQAALSAQPARSRAFRLHRDYKTDGPSVISAGTGFTCSVVGSLRDKAFRALQIGSKAFQGAAGKGSPAESVGGPAVPMDLPELALVAEPGRHPRSPTTATPSSGACTPAVGAAAQEARGRSHACALTSRRPRYRSLLTRKCLRRYSQAIFR